MNHRLRAARAAAILAVGISASATAVAVPAAAAVTDTPGVPPALMDQCGTGPLVTEPSRMILTCGDANNRLTDMSWGLWSADHAIGIGTEHINMCEPDCARGTFRSIPALVYLDQPRPLPNGQGTRFSHATVVTTDGVNSYLP
ncbi:MULTISPECIES: hypothetical protein [Rhodococcus]|jgi:hypothetical protein|uniref:Secreted protein n=1 Tax=Rhodococcus jostii (strain RHA1) TaxID=101510 RepID=Q0S117_RHOJR|nr:MULTISPECIES: hypothetical protein [Rhodococcus]ABG98769.1 conserved hypothetical protein [Rhodococcus jostii RHA1]